MIDATETPSTIAEAVIIQIIKADDVGLKEVTVFFTLLLESFCCENLKCHVYEGGKETIIRSTNTAMMTPVPGSKQ